MRGECALAPVGGVEACTQQVVALRQTRTHAEKRLLDQLDQANGAPIIDDPAGWVGADEALLVMLPASVESPCEAAWPGLSPGVSADVRAIGSDATRNEVLSFLDGAHIFHDEGHADLAGDDPWNAHLRLADGPLTVLDVLAHRPRTGTVLLIGCKAGSAMSLSRYESLGLAEAFLLAGADRVIAPDRTVSDAEAARFVKAFYAHHGAERPAEAFRATVTDLGESGNGWRYFGRP